MLDVVTIETPELGDRSYLAHDGTSGVVVDPQRDVDRFLTVIADLGVRVTHVLETHMHNDYVTGGLVLAKALGATYVVAEQDRVAFERQAARDGDEIVIGSLRLRIIATPGHTDHHLAYAMTDGTREVVFTGGSLLYGATGRTDLLGPELTDSLTRAQFRSVTRLAAELAPETEVLPTHGFGSFCAASATTVVDSSTIARERRENLALTVKDEDEFVRITVAGLTAYPRYYAHMGYLNLSGPIPADLSAPTPVDAAELVRRLQGGEWVVDLRGRRAYASGHLAGTYGVELGKDFASYLGWILPWGTALTLVGDTAEQVATAQRDLVRIGIDRVSGALSGGAEHLRQAGELREYAVADFQALAKAQAGPEDGRPYVLDVRHDHEWGQGHVAGAHHIPFEDLLTRVDEVPTDREVWIHCRTGMRASISASMVDAAGGHPVLIDDEWDMATSAGLPMADTH